MSIDIYFQTVIGYTFKKEHVTKEQQMRACNHDTDLTKKFCSECGKPVYEKVVIDLLEENNFETFEVFEFGCESYQYYAVGIGSESVNFIDYMSTSVNLEDIPENLEQYAKEIQQELMQHGITVSLEDFGFHSVVSY